MAYSTIADVLTAISNDELVKLTTDSGTSYDSTIINGAIAEADNIIDGYLFKRYSVPFATVPSIIKGFSIKIAIHLLYQRRGLVQEARQQAFENVSEILDQIANGTIRLAISGVEPTSSETKQYSESNDRIFTGDTMKVL